MSNRLVLVCSDLELDFARSIYRVDPFSRSNTIPANKIKNKKLSVNLLM